MWAVPNERHPAYCTLTLAKRLAAQAYRADVATLTATYRRTDWSSPWPSLYDHLALLGHHGGFMPLEATRAAAHLSAKTIGQDDNLGTQAPGKLASIDFPAKDPSSDIGNLRAVVLTVRGARTHGRSDHKPITKDGMKGRF